MNEVVFPGYSVAFDSYITNYCGSECLVPSGFFWDFENTSSVRVVGFVNVVQFPFHLITCECRGRSQVMH